MRRFFINILVLLIMCLLAGCGLTEDDPVTSSPGDSEKPEDNVYTQAEQVEIAIDTYKNLVELYQRGVPEIAPPVIPEFDQKYDSLFDDSDVLSGYSYSYSLTISNPFKMILSDEGTSVFDIEYMINYEGFEGGTDPASFIFHGVYRRDDRDIVVSEYKSSAGDGIALAFRIFYAVHYNCDEDYSVEWLAYNTHTDESAMYGLADTVSEIVKYIMLPRYGATLVYYNGKYIFDEISDDKNAFIEEDVNSRFAYLSELISESKPADDREKRPYSMPYEALLREKDFFF
jgi:lipoprotein